MLLLNDNSVKVNLTCSTYQASNNRIDMLRKIEQQDDRCLLSLHVKHNLGKVTFLQSS